MLQKKAAEATKGAIERADGQTQHVVKLMDELESIMQQRLDDQAAKSLRECKLGDEEVIRGLRPEIKEALGLIKQKAEDCQEHAEDLSKSTVAQLRDEIETTTKRIAANSDRQLDKRVQDLTLRMDQGFDKAQQQTNEFKSGAEAALQETSNTFKRNISEIRTVISALGDQLRQQIADVDSRAAQAAEEAQRRAVDASLRSLEDTASVIRQELKQAQKQAADAREVLRHDSHEQIQETAKRLEHFVTDMCKACDNAALVAVQHASAELRAEKEQAIKASDERTDAVRCAAAEALHAEVESRRKALLAADGAREALAATLRSECHAAVQKASTDAQTLFNAVDQKLNTTNVLLKSLERSLEADHKELLETATSLRNQLKAERQHTEEADADGARHMLQVRDTLEAHLQSQVADLRSAIADCRKRLHAEVDALRNEIREQPTRSEVSEATSAVSERCNDLMAALDEHRGRLENAVVDHTSRCRDISGEVGESKLKLQRDLHALNDEVTRLRSASTSLAYGIIKALQVIGLVADEAKAGAAGNIGTAVEVPLGTLGINGEHRARGLELEDLLEWDKVGRSLAARITHQWNKREAAGIPTVLAMVDRKAELAVLAALQNSVGKGLPGSFMLMGTNSRHH